MVGVGSGVSDRSGVVDHGRRDHNTQKGQGRLYQCPSARLLAVRIGFEIGVTGGIVGFGCEPGTAAAATTVGDWSVPVVGWFETQG